ncbi:hypothetical protein HHK36_015738 [Tetracentron sinense]|uniref:TPX2 C-terminal domain-containing protein n=1 Tax=Tetracentron sinense TaxID=13715 RepID=A0A834Z5Q4_TETSI|nr:hypothetical protein HHK36_015738 [Tetracentron sinense]
MALKVSTGEMFVLQGGPIHALGESISFGRFVSESLSWEKWSSFSNNRYLEEVEKYSKPGSVAQKKAYFEAHYKRIAAKKAVALLEEANTATNNDPEPQIEREVHNTTGQDSEWTESNSHVKVDESQEVEAPNTKAEFAIDANGYNSNAKMNQSKITKVDEANLVTENQVLVEDPTQVEPPNQLGDVEKHDKDAEMELSGTSQTEKPLFKESFTVYGKTLASTTKIQQAVSSPKPSVYSRVSKLLSYSAKTTTPIRPIKESNVTPNSKKTARDSVDKRRSTPKSLHMSINLTPPARETNKLTSPILQKIGSSIVAASSYKASKDCSIPRKTPTRVPISLPCPSFPKHTPLIALHTKQDFSCMLRRLIFKLQASVNGVPKHPSVTPQSENRRTKTPVDLSVLGSKTVGPKWHSLSLDHSKSLGVCGNKERSPTVSSSFSFKNDERSAKRKEARPDPVVIFTIIILPDKEKAETELRNLRQNLGFKARPMPDFYREIESSKNQIKKVPLTWPRSPKFGKKPSPSKVQYTSPLPPRRPSIKNDGSKRAKEKNNHTPAHTTEKNNHTPAHSLTSLPKKNTHENASPNIQH